MKTSVVVLTDSVLLSEGMTRILESFPHFELCACATTLDRAKEVIRRTHAKLMVLEPHLLDAVMRQNVRAEFAGLMGDGVRIVLVALVCRYVEQTVLRQFDGVMEVTDSRKRIESVMLEALQRTQSEDKTSESGSSDLSERERDVLVCVARGMANKEIAELLNISIHTVISHRKNIVVKTGIKSVAGLTVYALMNGLIEDAEIR